MSNYILDDKLHKRFSLIAEIFNRCAVKNEITSGEYSKLLVILTQIYRLPVPLHDDFWNQIRESMIDALEIETQVTTTVIRRNVALPTEDGK